MVETGSAPFLLLVSALVSAVLHLVAEYRGSKRFTYVFKPLTTALLVSVAAMLPTDDPGYRLPIITGLVCSLVGDIFLMLPHDHFVAGLVSFLVAHVAYLVAFSRDVPFGSRPLLLFPYVVIAVAILRLIWSRLGKLRLPVVIYVGALVAMAWQASTRAAVAGSVPAYAAAVGAALFIVSDGFLALNRFRKSFRAAQLVIMTTYVAAQALIACSVLRAG